MKGYRTLIVNVLVALAGVLTAFGVVLPEDFAQQLATNADAAIGAVTALVALANLLLRAITTTPIGQKD